MSKNSALPRSLTNPKLKEPQEPHVLKMADKNKEKS